MGGVFWWFVPVRGKVNEGKPKMSRRVDVVMGGYEVAMERWSRWNVSRGTKYLLVTRCWY